MKVRLEIIKAYRYPEIKLFRESKQDGQKIWKRIIYVTLNTWLGHFILAFFLSGKKTKYIPTPFFQGHTSSFSLEFTADSIDKQCLRLMRPNIDNYAVWQTALRGLRAGRNREKVLEDVLVKQLAEVIKA